MATSTPIPPSFPNINRDIKTACRDKGKFPIFQNKRPPLNASPYITTVIGKWLTFIRGEKETYLNRVWPL